MTTVAIHQPDFVPYLGFFSKMQQADVFILYDTAQYSKNGYHNRNRIKTPRGPAWITIPVRSPGAKPIRSVTIDNSPNWGQRIWRTLEANYRRAPYFDSYSGMFEQALHQKKWTRLAELNTHLLQLARQLLSIDAKLVLASELVVDRSTDPTAKLVMMTRAAGGDTYLSGPGGKDYLDTSQFGDIRLEFAESPTVAYPQLWGAFAPNLSIVDALFNCGPRAQSLLFPEASRRAHARMEAGHKA